MRLPGARQRAMEPSQDPKESRAEKQAPHPPHNAPAFPNASSYHRVVVAHDCSFRVVVLCQPQTNLLTSKLAAEFVHRFFSASGCVLYMAMTCFRVGCYRALCIVFVGNLVVCMLFICYPLLEFCLISWSSFDLLAEAQVLS